MKKNFKGLLAIWMAAAMLLAMMLPAAALEASAVTYYVYTGTAELAADSGLSASDKPATTPVTSFDKPGYTLKEINVWSWHGPNSYDTYTLVNAGQLQPDNLNAEYSDNDVILDPVYTPIIYNIVFNANVIAPQTATGSTTSMTNVTLESDKTISANGFESEGFDFVSWRLENNASIPANSDVATVIEKALKVNGLIDKETNTITLYAIWRPEGGSTEGTATRDPRGGACLLFWFMHEVDFVIDEATTETVTVRYGNVIEAPEVTAPEGYEFTGWYTDADCTEAFDLATKFRTDVIREVETLYAGFAPIAADETEDADFTADPKENPCRKTTNASCLRRCPSPAPLRRWRFPPSSPASS